MSLNWEEETADHMDDIIDIVDNSQSVPVLLPEILSHVFAYLPLTDRKSVRLTCRSWYDYSVRRNVIKREKHIFRIDSSIEDIAEFMLQSNYSLLNLEFQGVRLKELPADAWINCGERIQTLEFYKCQWSFETIRNVILYCQNLTSIVTTPRRRPKCDLTKILSSSNLLDDLIKKGLRRSKLRTFTIFNDDENLPESVLNKVFLLFPGIKHFSTGVVSFKIPFLCSPPWFREESPWFLRLDQCFNRETRLESLTLNSLMDGNWIKTLVEKAEHGFRLKKLETMLVYRRSVEDTLFEFFKLQRNLEVLKLGIAEANYDENKKLFFHILDSCPNLQEFFFESETGHLIIGPSELPRFIASISKLKFLDTVFYGCHDTPLPLYHDLLAKSAQLNLTSLRWNCKDADFCAAFFQLCPSLLHLHFGGCRDEMFQIIFQFLVELRTLVLCNIDSSCTDYGFTGRGVDGIDKGYSIKRLHQLKYLKLQGNLTSLTRESTLELQLPRLEYLSLSITWLLRVPIGDEALDHFASGLPELRVLKVDNFFAHLVPVMKRRFWPHLKNLCCLIGFKISCNLEMGFAEDIFGFCPRLRYIICHGDFGVFSRNPFTGKVLRNNMCSFKHPENVFEGELSAFTA